jgi:hypothetical protein
VRHTTRVLTKQELTRQLLALVLTAVLVWHTVVVPPIPRARAKGPRRRMPGDKERETESRRGKSRAGARVASVESVDDLDWPEFISLD